MYQGVLVLVRALAVLGLAWVEVESSPKGLGLAVRPDLLVWLELLDC
jgi:hypothetical protein